VIESTSSTTEDAAMSAQAPAFDIVIPLYDGVNLLDVSEAVEMFFWMGEAWKARTTTITLVAATRDAVTTREGVCILPQRIFDDYADCGDGRPARQSQLIWTPGGSPAAVKREMQGGACRDFIVAQSGGADYVCSVCEGALILAGAGLLDGYTVTTHWAFIPCLAAYPQITVADGFPRYVIDRNRITGGGVASGLDEALAIIALLAGDDIARNVQLQTQYFPDPPFTQTITPATTCPLPAD
jgi:cyclohexyl-isocyanide hydratase